MPRGNLLLILHAHLPYVRHPEFDRFLEERWFFEAVTETYIPLIKFFDRLRAEGKPFKLTLSVSPTLANMMEDPLLRERCVRHFDSLVELAESELQRTRDWPDVTSSPRCTGTSSRTAPDLRGALPHPAGLGLQGARRVRAPGADHLRGHTRLPAAANSEPATVRPRCSRLCRNISGFSGASAGMWVPECAFYPGLDEILAEAGMRYFVVDSHAIEHADPRPLFGVPAPLYCPSGVAAFGRHPTTSKLVWSSKVGYPADYNYREYYRDIGFELDQHYLEPFQYAQGVRTPVGIKYHRITGPGPDKHLYNPDWARETAKRHARDFVGRCREQAVRAGSRMPFPSVIVSPYDAELFGHWWFEGPQWIYHVIRELATAGPRAGTPGEYLRAPDPAESDAGTEQLGPNGYNEHWVTPRRSGCGGLCTKPPPGCVTRCRPAGGTHGPPSGACRTGRSTGGPRMMLPRARTGRSSSPTARPRSTPATLQRSPPSLPRSAQRPGGPEDRRPEARALEYMDAIFPDLDYRLFAPAGEAACA